jgi:two-component system CheB/CheR fusion protein
MTEAVRDLLRAFHALSPAEQHQMATEILRRWNMDESLPSAALDQVASELFRSYDADEGAGAAQRRELEREILEAAAAEQRRIGQDLHDQVGQELTGVSLLAQNVVESLRDRSAAETRTMAKVLDGLKRTLRLVRELSHGLMPVDVDPEGLRAALQNLAERTREVSGINCNFRCSRHVRIEDHAVATHLYRITKEAVTNALRHAEPKNIRIMLVQTSRRGNLRVWDDGQGIMKPDERGMGLKMMHHRAELIGGKLTIRRGPNGGTVVSCVFPVRV